MIRFIGAFDKVSDLPRGMGAEYAFVGRSNVGKSSLLNAVAGSAAAKVSNTPGRTRTINLFDMDGAILADLPGYGYARASKDDQLRWLRRLEEYLAERRELKLLFVLVDSRHGIKDIDKVLIDFCEGAGIPYKIIYTKCDKRDARKLDGIMTSSAKKIGIEEVKCYIK